MKAGNGAYYYTDENDSNRIITFCKVAKIVNNVEEQEFHDYRFLWDTGATNTMISQKIINELHLEVKGCVPIIYGGGGGKSNIYDVAIILPNSLLIQKIKVGTLSLNCEYYDGIIGMDIISMGDFCISGEKGKRVFSFCVPSMGIIDLKVMK